MQLKHRPFPFPFASFSYVLFFCFFKIPDFKLSILYYIEKDSFSKPFTQKHFVKRKARQIHMRQFGLVRSFYIRTYSTDCFSQNNGLWSPISVTHFRMTSLVQLLYAKNLIPDICRQHLNNSELHKF